jgi:hypothetical protein
MKSSLAGSLSVSLLLSALAIFTGTLTAQTQPSAGNAPKGSIERIKVHGASLEGNLEGDTPAASPATAPAQGNNARGPGAEGRGRRTGGFGNVISAQAAAWSPNPANPPQYFDLPTKDGQDQPLVAAKWAANSPLVMVSQYVPNLKQYRAKVMDVGDKDFLKAMNADLDKELTRLEIPHVFEQYEGDHGNRVAPRFQNNLLTFFSQQLKFPEAPRR